MESDTTPIGNSDWLKEYKLALSDMVECETEKCALPATQFTQFSCCNAVAILCEGCMNQLVTTLHNYAGHGKPVKCAKCTKMNNPVGWITRPKRLVDNP